MYIDIRKEDIFVADPTFAMSLESTYFASCKEDICIESPFLSGLSAALDRVRFYIPAVRLDAGLRFCCRNAGGIFSFAENFESIIKTLSLTVCNVVKYCRRKVSRAVFNAIGRTKNVVRSTAPRFLRL